jgi:tRNA(Ile)-lysidine synthase
VGNKIEKIFKSKISSLRHSKFLIALSGGVDSMVLANLFLNNNLSFSVAHCNFNLRDKESDMMKNLFLIGLQKMKLNVIYQNLILLIIVKKISLEFKKVLEI